MDRRKVDFSDVASGRLPPVHPGEVLRDEFLTPMELGVYRLARAIGVSRLRLNDVVLGRHAVTTDTALRLGRYFGTTPEFWVNLQTRCDLDVAERTVGRRIEQEVAPRAVWRFRHEREAVMYAGRRAACGGEGRNRTDRGWPAGGTAERVWSWRRLGERGT